MHNDDIVEPLVQKNGLQGRVNKKMVYASASKASREIAINLTDNMGRGCFIVKMTSPSAKSKKFLLNVRTSNYNDCCCILL